MENYIQRDAYEKLLQWKRESAGATALLIEGARRVGKSVLADEFGSREYASRIIIDFSKVSSEFKQAFLDTRGDLDQFFLYLEAFTGGRLVERDTLIIFDEIQLFPQAREFIKHLVADGRYDYMETGSLISLKRNVKDILIPSEEEGIVLRPFCFGEFLEAMGEGALRRLIANARRSLQPLPAELHRKAERLFREYMIVGGMPQAVVPYAEGRNLAKAERAKRVILRLYREDIAKFGGDQAHKIATLFDDIPSQLSRKEKKLVYADLEKDARSRDYEEAISWLAEARLVNNCFASTDPEIGLNMSRSDKLVKCYLADTGLLATMAYGDDEASPAKLYAEILQGKIETNEGMLVENVVAQQLAASGRALHFYTSYSRAAEDRMEIDFLIRAPYPNAAMKTRVSPIEVKSGKRYKTVSLDKFKKKFAKRVGTEFVLHPRPLEVRGDRVYLPLYMSGLI